MEQDLERIESLYDSVAKEYAEAFSGEHEKKPKDQEMLRRFSQKIGDRRPVWDLGCGPGQTTSYLKIVELFLGKRIDMDFMFFTPGFISDCLTESGFEAVEIIEREPYLGVEYQSRRAYVFALKPVVPKSLGLKSAN